ncbi:MAG: hypothetical protein ABI779_05210 [Acidobacteriota bacterium]
MIVRATHAITSALIPLDKQFFSVISVIIERFRLKSDPCTSKTQSPSFRKFERFGADSTRPTCRKHVDFDQDSLTLIVPCEVKNNNADFAFVVAYEQRSELISSMNVAAPA